MLVLIYVIVLTVIASLLVWRVLVLEDTASTLRLLLTQERTKVIESCSNMSTISMDLSIAQKEVIKLTNLYRKEVKRNNDIWSTTKHLQGIVNKRIRMKNRVVRRIKYKLTQEWNK